MNGWSPPLLQMTPALSGEVDACGTGHPDPWANPMPQLIRYAV